MKTVIVQNALDFTDIYKANLHQVTTHLKAKDQLKKVENLNLWSVFPAVKDIPKTHEQAFQ